MFNPNVLQFPRVVGGAFLAASMALAACSGQPNAPVNKPEYSLSAHEPCIDDNNPELPSWSKELDTTPLSLRYDRDRQVVETDPLPPESFFKNLRQAAVLVKNEKTGTGSGFITLDPEGNQIVVTAAHVLAGANKEDLTVEGAWGENSAVQSSRLAKLCYVNMYDGRMSASVRRSPPRETRKTDFAILRLETPVPVQPLKLATAAPGKGEWLFFVNFQNLDPRADRPVEYGGIVVGDGIVITGVQPWRSRDNGGAAYIAMYGASGGLLANIRGEVAAISSFASIRMLRAEELRGLYNTGFDVPIGRETNITPVYAEVMSSTAIAMVIQNSPRY